MTHWTKVQLNPPQKIGANTIKVRTAKIKLSKNCPINVETKLLVTKANLPSGFFLKARPMKKLEKRMIYIFDPMFERCFFGSVKEIKSGSMDGVKCVEKSGKAPEQSQPEDAMSNGIVGKDGKADWESDEDFYGDSQYDEGDLDMEGFQDLSFEDGSMF